MKPWLGTAGLCAALLAVLPLGVVTAKKSQPDISSSKFEGPLVNLKYFDDSDVVTVIDSHARKLYRSTNAGADWTPVTQLDDLDYLMTVLHHPTDNKTAIALGQDNIHYITRDRGENWRKFETDGSPTLTVEPISWHADDSSKIIFSGEECDEWGLCDNKAWYTEDGFDTIHLLRDKVSHCVWARTDSLFNMNDDDMNSRQVVCIAEGKYSTWTRDYRLLTSSDYFRRDETEPELERDRTVYGIVNIAAVKGFMVVAVKSEGTLELALYATKDTMTWHRAVFGDHSLEEKAYTVLESTAYSIQVDVMSSFAESPMGTLYTSNSNGTYFSQNVEHTNRNLLGYVDFEKIQNIQGIVMVNTVKNWEDVEKSFLADKRLQTSISFDDGRNFVDMKVGKDRLHLHSVTDQRNTGRIFSSPAPGLVMGVGNTGDHLESMQDGNLYVSSDGGVHWDKALDGPHFYEFGDKGAVLMAVYDGGEVDQVMFSMDFGRNWEAAKLPDDNVKPQQLTTVPDSTTLKFILYATRGTGAGTEYVTYGFDFNGLHERQCEKGDFETWHARVDEDGEPACIMGHTQAFRRRKPDANCFVEEDFTSALPIIKDCDCTDADFECDYNFVRNDQNDCVAARPLEAPAGACKSTDDKFEGSSGWRLIPGNRCRRGKGQQKDDPIDRPCSETDKIPADGQISHTINTFRSSNFREHYYLEKQDSGHGKDETIIMLTDDRDAHISHDHGKTWEDTMSGSSITGIYPHPYFSDVVYLTTSSRTVHYSKNRGETFHYFEAPEYPNEKNIPALSFHPTERDWMIWNGGKDCIWDDDDCHIVSHVSRKGGEEWTELLPWVRKCQFVYREDRKNSEQMVYCEQYEGENPSKGLQLISSDDWFEHKTVHYKDVIDFATMAEYIIVAVRDGSGEQQTLRVDASIDGKTFANAQFPRNFEVKHSTAYTVLDSSTHSVFLHVTTNNRREQEFGTIIKSNSNGTEYVKSIEAVNRNVQGYVDFEKMQGIEGVALVNVVANEDDVKNGQAKQLQTRITHNDGAEWGLLTPPDVDADGKNFVCEDASIDQCALHLHGYTERSDPRNSYSSPSAVGLMLAIGNVGPTLGRRDEGDTFITSDGGITWRAAMKGPYMWEFGDQGSIIVIIQKDTPTRILFYTLDEGENWRKYEFGDGKDYVISEISTVPSDKSRNFLLWGKEASSSNRIATINIDFSGLTDNLCDDDDLGNDKSDYYLWEPKHPLSDDNCLFGHVAQYKRKKTDRTCYNGKQEIHRLHNVARNCSCTRQDFECDYNYQRQNDGSCALVEGYTPLDPQSVCENDGVYQYFDPTGYRRIPLTTCEGGRELEYTSTSHPCPGKENEWRKHNGLSGFAIFFIILVSLAAAGGIGYYISRNWNGQFGQIRLDTGSGFSPRGAGAFFDSDRPWIRYPVAVASGIVAVLVAVPLLASSLWRSAAGRLGFGGGYSWVGSGSRPYTSRSSFARDRQSYTAVDEDEGELLGDDEDEEV